MKIGYACLTKAVPDTNFKSLQLKNLNKENLYNIIDYNLNSLDNILDYNIKNNIGHFRISSDIIPFGSHEDMIYNWQEDFKDNLTRIGEKIDSANIRVSMHPGQYTVLNSPNEEVLKKAIRDLEYHDDFLSLLNRNSENKIILHIGGVYGDKQNAIERFNQNYKNLDDRIKNRLVIENDDKSYNIDDVLDIAVKNNIPVVYDNLHNKINHLVNRTDRENILLANKTWKTYDGRQKVHYSQQGVDKKIGSHSESIDLNLFKDYYKEIKDLDIDIILEVKDKNLSAIKVNNYIYGSSIKMLENEWGRYKYSILEHSPKAYNDIRSLLKDKDSYPILEFYNLIDGALAEDISLGRSQNALDHVWGYFKNKADESEKAKYERYLKNYRNSSYTIKPLKNYLFNLSKKYKLDYLINSYYFWI